ncbi:flavin reductase domain-containing FMN-binding protein [Arthrobacter crystallopoietes BAB-32]|uniref:Flavin reductase domain-containing FMN-binding protein n=1 Tax=Arthrobacter crystallopoietes BAB-32 TaxID=1246476 RepID=N1V7L9_9MICC|nr:flavin reductase family protein [Arthrobacter crystallopoietes]EMY36004.1 flavin reductase domain-containing FMN-binding protein [Arthrobacter crystallopoietes BAB-32]
MNSTLTKEHPARIVDSQDMARAMRSVLGNFCTGVAVMTAQTAEGPVGMTAQSLVSISLEPPLVMFSPQKTSKTWPQIERTGSFCANILPVDRRDLGLRFAKSGTDKFAGVDWQPGLTGAPVLDGALAFIECSVEHVYEAGDHYMVLGRVRDLGEKGPGEPLLFFKGGFGSFNGIPRNQD